MYSVEELEPPGAATFSVELAVEPIFCWLEPRASAAFFQVAPAASFLPSKKESLVVVTKRDIRAIFYGKCDPK